MPAAGTLDFVLTANSSQLRQELGKVRQESQATALAITNLFSGETINAIGVKLVRGTVTGLISDIDELNHGLSLSESLTRNFAASFSDLGDIALLQLGQIAQFLGDDLFETPLAGLQSASLERVGLGQLEGAFQIITAGSNAAKVLEVALGGTTSALASLDGALGGVQDNAQATADFFRSIAENAQIAQSILVTSAQLIDTAIDQLLDTLGQLSPEFATIREAAKALGIEFSVGQAIFGDYINDLERLDQAASTAADASEEIADGAESARRGVSSAGNTIDEFGNKLKSQQKAAAGFEGAIKDLADAGQLLDVYNQANGLIEGFTGSIEENFNAAKGAENLRNRLELVSESAGGAREDLQFLGKLTNDLGVNFDAAAQGYTSFSTAANLANLSVDQTKEIFAGVTQASSAFGLSAADTQGVFLALQQSLSGGNVQLEELNQLAERIPGTFQAAASALGVTTKELKGLISTGTVSSAEFLPAFAQQLKAFTEAGVVDAMNSGEAAVNRFNNALGEFQVAAGQAWLEVGTPALNTFSQALSFAAKNEELFSTAIDAVALTSLGLFAVGAFKASKAVIEFIATNKTATIQLFGQQISVTAAQIGKLGAQVALVYAATVLFYRVMDRAKDSAEGTRSAIASLDKSLKDLGDASQKSGNALKSALPEEPPPLDWLDKAVKGLKDAEEGGNLFGKAIRVATQFTPVGLGLELNKLVNFIKTGNYEIVTASEKALNDQLVAIGDFSSRAQEILGKSFEFRQTAKNGGGALAELKEVELALKQIEQQRLKADPKDEKTLSRLGEEEAELLKRYGDAQKEVTANQSALNNALTQAKQELQNLDPAKLGTKGYEQAKQQIETQINLLEKEKVKFDELTKKAEVTAESITTNFEKASTSLDRGFSDAQAKIEEALASGEISQEEYQQRQLDSERKYLEDRLKLNRDTAEKLKAELDRNAKLKAIDPSKATLTTEKEEEYQKQLQQIEVDTAKTRIDLAKNTQATKADLQEQELNTIRENQAEAEAILQRTENERIAAIKQRQAIGAISEEEANRQIEQVQKESITTQIAQEKEKLEQIRALKAEGTLNAKEAAEQEREILGNLSDLNLQRVDLELKAREEARRKEEEANRKTLENFEASIKRADQAIAQSQNARQQALAKAQLAGLPQEEAARQTAAIEQEAIAKTIALREQELAKVGQLRSRGVINAKEAADREAEIIATIGDLKLQQIQSEIAAQQQVIDAVGQAADDQVQLASNAEAAKIAAIKEAQAQRVVSEEDAAAQIAQVNQKTVEQNLQIKQDELAQIQALRKSGQLSIEEAADQEQTLIGEISTLRQQAAEAEIARQEQIKQAKIAALDQELAAAQSAAEVLQGQRDLEIQSIQNRSNLISAQSGLMQAQTALTQQRLQFAIQEAEQAGNLTQAEALKKQLVDEQIRAQEQQFKIDLEQLKLQQEQNKLEMENAQTKAEVAIKEAQYNLLKAQQNDASLQELQILSDMLGMRQQQLDAVNSQIANQSKLNALEQAALRTQQQLSREKLNQQKITAQTATVTASSSSSSGNASFSGGGGSPVNAAASMAGMSGMGGGQKGLSLTAAADKMMGLAMSKGTLADVFNASNMGLKMKLNDDFGSGFIRGNIGGGNSEIAGKLDQLIAATRSSAGRPNLSISNVNDLGMAGQIYSDISRDGFRSAGL